MKKLLYGLFCFVFFVLAIPASAQEAPQTTTESTDEQQVVLEETETVESDATTEQADGPEVVEEPDSQESEGSTGDESETDEPTVEEAAEESSKGSAADGSGVETASTEIATEVPNILIGEVNWAGSELSQADEWIELYNAHGADVDLSGWILTGCATSGNAIALADGTMLAAGNVLLVSNYDLGSDKTTLTVRPDLVTASVSLSNSSLEIMLAMPDGTVVDVAGDGGSPPSGSTDPKASMQRDLATLGWYSSGSNTNLSDSNQLGTPGTLYVTSDTTEETEGVKEADQSSLVINEFVSDPAEDQEEWVEIYNPTGDSVELEGWTVHDAIERSSVFDKTSIESGSYAVIYSPSGQLNNGGDTIELVDPDGSVVDSITYGTDEIEAPEKSYSLALIENVWTVTTEPTPGSLNIFSDEVQESDAIEEVEEVDTPSIPSEAEGSLEADEEEAEEEAVDDEVVNQTDDSDESETSESLSYESGVLIINELVSDPVEGEVEWVELYNTTDNSIDLTGWSVADATDRKTELKGTIGPNEYAVVEEPKGKLNNGGDTVYLYDPAGDLIDSISYGTEEVDKPNKGESLALSGSDWAVTSDITKSAANEINYEEEQNQQDTENGTQNTEDEAQSESSTTETSESSTDQQDEHKDVQHDQQASTGNDNDVSTEPETHRVVAIAETPKTTSSSSSSSSKSNSSYSSASADEVVVSGIVTALPGTFGSQIAFIEGAQLYFYYADWPMLKLGDVVTASGELSESRGEQRVKLSEMGDVQITGHVDLNATSTSINGLDSMLDGSLVTVRGEVIDMNDTKIVLRDSTGSVTIVANTHEGMQWSSMSSELEITGVLRTVSGEQRVYPRTSQDVVQIQEEVNKEVSDEVPVAAAQSNNITPWIGGGLLLAALIGLAYFFVRRTNLQTAPAGA